MNSLPEDAGVGPVADSASGQALRYAGTGLPPGLSIGAGTGTITGRPRRIGDSVTVTASNGTGASGSAIFIWTVSAGIGILASLLRDAPGGRALASMLSASTLFSTAESASEWIFAARGRPAG